MKVCILSMQRVNNFGSLLQSYALKKMLEECGHTVSFLDIERNEEDDKLRNHKDSKNQTRWGKCISKLKKIDRYTLNRVRVKRLDQKQKVLFEEFRNTHLSLQTDCASQCYDCCVIGSDEVFNCMTESPWGFTSQLFGDVKQADRVITYAASCGATTYEELPEPVASRIGQAFEKISAFSVRDENTCRFVSHLTDKPVETHFDPVVVGDFEAELNITKLPAGLPEKYCVVYSYYNRISDKGAIREIRRFCRKHGLDMIAVGAPQMWIRNYPALDPFQVLKVFRNAQFVVTDTFHGTIFSAKYARKFAVMTRANNENKLQDLIGRLNLKKHQIHSFDQLDDAYAAENHAEAIRELGREERKRTLQYLKNNVAKQKEQA